MIPETYDLKRVVARHWKRFWCGDELARLMAAPVYHFADLERFDLAEAAHAGERLAAGPVRLPHPHVVFEVADRAEEIRALVAYAWETDAGVDAILLARHRTRRLWSDVLVRACFRDGGWAEVEGNPRAAPEENSFGLCLTAMVCAPCEFRPGRHGHREDRLTGAPPEVRGRRNSGWAGIRWRSFQSACSGPPSRRAGPTPAPAGMSDVATGASLRTGGVSSCAPARWAIPNAAG